ncbi:nose resistant to fluoxetine protein 6-like [Choristoneura fumiferana]|uniref:nose resistant to fluoxetine protein 6-like n=1 Tax=Choristoneura fumiferana TaxID=7141 RepID=UPI003D15C061
MVFKYIVFALVLSASKIDGYDAMSRSAFDDDLYENVLDEELCEKQLVFLSNDALRLPFLDASARFPSGFLTGNLNDLGDYHQCLAIDQNVNDMEIQGKYCMVAVPLQEIALPELPVLPNITWPEWPVAENDTEVQEVMELWISYDRLQTAAHVATGLNEPSNNRTAPMAITSALGPTFAICIPKVCSAKQAVDFVQERFFLNITYQEVYCRLPNDKPFAPADYVAFAIIGIILLLVGLSTGYDLYFTMVLQQKSSPLYRSFSVYTNTKRFLTFNTYPGALECVDGIRAISMMWVIVGHAYLMTLMGYIHNLEDIFVWLRQFSSTWVNSAPITVDTFFCLSGILCVYTTIGKISRTGFAKTIHLFYINRLLRMFPLLAAVVLLQASIFNHVSDGPYWQNVASSVQNCRKYWWAALLHVQNYVNPSRICLGQTWYLSVDVQLYIICPFILLCMFGSRRVAWASLAFITLLSLVSSSLYSFLFNFSAALIHPNRIGDLLDYMKTYYMNTLARAPPFFVGMAYGYLLHLWKDKEIRIPRIYSAVLWVISFILMAFCIFSIYPVMQLEHEAQVFDNLLNAYMRAIWALGLGWLILACVKGYGGPINWFLSLSIWKLPARMSFAMYLLHFPIITVANGSWVKSYYFTNGDTLYRFGSVITFTFVFAFVLSILIDAPFSTLQKLLLGKGKRRTPVKAESQEVIVENRANDTKTRL